MIFSRSRWGVRTEVTDRGVGASIYEEGFAVLQRMVLQLTGCWSKDWVNYTLQLFIKDSGSMNTKVARSSSLHRQFPTYLLTS
jgi:hypothetical protein